MRINSSVALRPLSALPGLCAMWAHRLLSDEITMLTFSDSIQISPLLLQFFLRCVFRVLIVLVPVGVFAAPAAGIPEPGFWLTRIHRAALENNFKGTLMVSAPGAISSAKIFHFREGLQQYEYIESLDGQPRQVFRHNEFVHTVWPKTQFVQLEQRESWGAFPALLSASSIKLADFYEIKREPGTERVAGHEADVLWLHPRDAYRFGYRLWAEKVSGLLLRADVWAQPHEVLETAVFSEVTIGVKPQPELVLRGMKPPEGYQVERVALTPIRIEEEGWALRQSIPGFYQVHCVKRSLWRSSASQQQVIQAVFSDGLTHVSIFIEPFDPTRHLQPVKGVVGATNTLSRRQRNSWVTVVGNVPPLTLRAFFDGLSPIK
jgi:sigma-E factor negative regulatory protein RseB